MRVFANHFSMLGARFQLGRGFLPDEGGVGADRVVVLSHGLWQRRFGGDEDVVGQVIELSGEPYTVVGVVAWEHQPLEEDWQLWVPLPRELDHWTSGSALVVNGRLKPGVGVGEAEAELRTLYRRYTGLDGADHPIAQQHRPHRGQLLLADLLALLPGRATREDAPATLHHRLRSRRTAGLSQSLVAAEMAVAVVLVVGAGLMLKSFSTLQGMLYEVSARDVTLYAAGPAVLLGFALLTLALPARRASRIDPISVLRQE